MGTTQIGLGLDIIKNISIMSRYDDDAYMY